MKASELTGADLDYWTARAEGIPADQLEIREVPRTDWKICVHMAPPIPGWMSKPERPLPYSTNWALGGPLLEKHRIDLVSLVDPISYQAEILCPARSEGEVYHWAYIHGDTALIAICRAVVYAAFGEEMEDKP